MTDLKKRRFAAPHALSKPVPSRTRDDGSWVAASDGVLITVSVPAGGFGTATSFMPTLALVKIVIALKTGAVAGPV